MLNFSQDELDKRLSIVSHIKKDLLAYYPRTLVLFGSTARYVAGIDIDTFPDDIDLLMVGGNLPPVSVESQDYGCKLEVHRLSEYQIVEIAKSLRYDVKALALSKLYSKVLAKNHAIDVIAACLLLGSEYGAFGIEQIEIDGRPDQRDYSVQNVLHGEIWWQQLCEYARERRGPFRLFSDKLVLRDTFEPKNDRS